MLILGRHAIMKCHMMSHPVVRFLQTWSEKMRKPSKEKFMERCIAICAGHETAEDFLPGGGGGGVKLTPPVKIGLSWWTVDS